jgi:hypothetical protein
MVTAIVQVATVVVLVEKLNTGSSSYVGCVLVAGDHPSVVCANPLPSRPTHLAAVGVAANLAAIESKHRSSVGIAKQTSL